MSDLFTKVLAVAIILSIMALLVTPLIFIEAFGIMLIISALHAYIPLIPSVSYAVSLMFCIGTTLFFTPLAVSGAIKGMNSREVQNR